MRVGDAALQPCDRQQVFHNAMQLLASAAISATTSARAIGDIWSLSNWSLRRSQ
jgi:hypothetical protein